MKDKDDNIFGGEVIFSYTRAQAIEDGFLVDVSEIAKEAGFKYPTVVTAALWNDIQEIPDFYCWEDPNGRLWDVVWMASFNARKNPGVTRFAYQLTLHTRDHQDDRLTTLICDCGPGDDREPVLTIGYSSDF